MMAKPVGSRCNMRCAYCYYLEKGRYSTHARQTRMGYDLLEKLVRQTIEASPGPAVSFTWHGGEPMLAGIEFYQKALALERKYLPRGWEAWNNLQTNGLLLNDAWCAFLKRSGFDVGVSVDGGALSHDALRRDMGGNGTWERVRRGIQRLRSFGIEPDLLCTVNAETVKDPEGVYRALRDLGASWVQFIPIVAPLPEGGCSAQSVTPEGYGGFLCRVFDLWSGEDLGRLDVQLFAECARVLAGGEAGLCWMRPACGRVLVAEEDGGVYSCDHFVDPGHRLGTLGREWLDAMADSPFQRRFGEEKRSGLGARCRRCPWLALCNGACPKDRFAVSDSGEPGQPYLCAGLSRFFAHAVPALRRIMALSAAGKGPGEIMAETDEACSREKPRKNKKGL